MDWGLIKTFISCVHSLEHQCAVALHGESGFIGWYFDILIKQCKDVLLAKNIVEIWFYLSTISMQL